MKEMLVILAKTMTKEQLVEKLHDEIINYKEAVMLGKEGEELEYRNAAMLMSAQLLLINAVPKSSEDIISDLGSMKDV